MYIGSWQWYDYPSLGSTNDLAKEQSENFSGTPSVYTAKVQTAGRGRRGRQWVSKEGNLFMSQLLKTEIPVSDTVFITAVSVAETIRNLTIGLQINIKWPNDVLIGGKKISGILIEAAANGTVVIGTGVNLANSPKDNEVIYRTDNLAAHGFDISREAFLSEYLKIFDANMNLRRKQGLAAILKKWLAYAYRLGQTIKVSRNSKVLEGIFKGIDEQGFLLLEQDQNIIKIAAGDISA